MPTRICRLPANLPRISPDFDLGDVAFRQTVDVVIQILVNWRLWDGLRLASGTPTPGR